MHENEGKHDKNGSILKSMKFSNRYAAKGLKRKLEETAAADEVKLNGTSEEKSENGSSNGHSEIAEGEQKNGHANGNTATDDKQSPVKKSKTDDDVVSTSEDKTEVAEITTEAKEPEVVITEEKMETKDAIDGEKKIEEAVTEKIAPVEASSEDKVDSTPVAEIPPTVEATGDKPE